MKRKAKGTPTTQDNTQKCKVKPGFHRQVEVFSEKVRVFIFLYADLSLLI